jgi:undecaprenyl-diphosphatase
VIPLQALLLLPPVLVAATGEGAAVAENLVPVTESIGFWEGALLGLIQGVAEFIPVSSSGHLWMWHCIRGQSDGSVNMAFDVAVHMATLFAMLLYFRDDIMRLFSRRPRLVGLVMAACIPAAAVGLLFGDWFDSMGVSNYAGYLIGVAFIFNGFVLLVSRFFGIETKRMSDLRLSDAVLIGMAQALAPLPGISRSGITITGGLICGLRRSEAFVFSFLLGMPLIAGAGAMKMRKIGEIAVSGSWLGMIAAFVTAFFSGLIAVWVLGKFVKRRNLVPFGIYTMLLGVTILVIKFITVYRGA